MAAWLEAEPLSRIGDASDVHAPCTWPAVVDQFRSKQEHQAAATLNSGNLLRNETRWVFAK